MAKPFHAAEGLSSPDQGRRIKVDERRPIPRNALSVAVDETLNYVFKEAGAEAIYSFLEKKCQLQRNEIPEKPGVFSKSLKRLLGSAAPVIESMIVKNLYGKFGVDFEKKAGYGFADYLVELRR